MQLQSFSTNLDDARLRADEIVRQLTASPDFAKQIQGDRTDLNRNAEIGECGHTCTWTCKWTSLEE